MQTGNNKVCPVCGKICRPRGIGAHMRLQHGVKLKTLISDSSDSSGHISELSDHISDSSGHISELSDLRVQRPSDFVKKHDKIVETRTEPVFELSNVDGYVGSDPPFGVSAISEKSWKRYQEELKRLKDLETKE